MVRGMGPATSHCRTHLLSDREYQVFNMLVMGARAFGDRRRTVAQRQDHQHAQDAHPAKMNLANAAELVRYAVAHGLRS